MDCEKDENKQIEAGIGPFWKNKSQVDKMTVEQMLFTPNGIEPRDVDVWHTESRINDVTPHSSTSVTRFVTGLGYFGKVLAINFLAKVAQILGYRLGYFEKRHFFK